MSILGPRAYHGTSTINHIIYVIGGFDGVEYFNSVRSFNPMTKDWKEKAPMNNKRYNPKVRACVDQLFFVFCLALGTLLVSNLSKQCSGGSRVGGYKHCNILSLNILWTFLNLQLSIHDMPNSKESIFYMYVDYICHFYVTVIILYVCITGVTSAQLSWETTSMPWEGMTVRWDRILLNGTFRPKTSGASFHQCNTVEAMPAPPHLTVNINFDLHQLFLSIHLCPIFKSSVLKNPNTGRGSSTAERSLLMTGRSWVRTPLVSNLRHWKGY